MEVVSLPAATAASLHPQIFRSLSASSLDNIEFNLSAINERAIASLLDFLDVNKDVPAAVVVLDETVPSLFVKPLHSPARHSRSPDFETEQTARLIRRPDEAQLKRTRPRPG